ncbi:MAG TPA: four-helix bundle copper-binding protein [Gemmatimonadaceae bacterium]|nr:four-helix bundle copper-binding protein [Gemmatimonadaceae bacterium]
MQGLDARLYIGEQAEDGVRACTECHELCTESAMRAVSIGGRHGDAEFVRLLLDCADISSTAARFLVRGSDMRRYACRACFAIAAHCADECERLGMLTCAESCRRCAEACAQLAMDPSAASSAILGAERLGTHA